MWASGPISASRQLPESADAATGRGAASAGQPNGLRPAHPCTPPPSPGSSNGSHAPLTQSRSRGPVSKSWPRKAAGRASEGTPTPNGLSGRALRGGRPLPGRIGNMVSASTWKTMPRRESISGSGHGPVPGRAAASRPAPTQCRGERPVVLSQACHLPGEPLELLPQDFALGVLPLDSLPQGFDLLAVPPRAHNLSKAAVNGPDLRGVKSGT